MYGYSTQRHHHLAVSYQFLHQIGGKGTPLHVVGQPGRLILMNQIAPGPYRRATTMDRSEKQKVQCQLLVAVSASDQPTNGIKGKGNENTEIKR